MWTWLASAMQDRGGFLGAVERARAFLGRCFLGGKRLREPETGMGFFFPRKRSVGRKFRGRES